MSSATASSTAVSPSADKKPPSGKWLFAAGTFVGACLLFQVQLIIGKYILPWFGGTTGVWATCLLFFQAVLLAGYAYAHWLTGKAAPRVQARIHAAVLAGSLGVMALTATLWRTPITPGADWKPDDARFPLWLILRLLAVSVGLPTLLVATTGPLLQRWYSYANAGASPYRLYALSNLGSAIGLVSYPALLEPLLRIATQAWAWSAAYVGYAVMAALCGRRAAASHAATEAETSAEPSPGARRQLLWVVLGALGSLMLLATTHMLTQDIAPIPLLWVLPLLVYLGSFIVCFEHPRWYKPEIFQPLLLAVVGMAIVIYRGTWLGTWMHIALFLLVLFACCMFCHGEVYRRRPGNTHLTRFYLAVAAGGVLGSGFVNLVAPLIFKGYWELPVGLALCAVMMALLAARDPDSWVKRGEHLLPLALVLWAAWVANFVFNPQFRSLAVYVQDWPADGLAALATITTVVAIVRSERGAEASRLNAAVLAGVVICAGAGVVWEGSAEYRAAEWAGRDFYGVLYVKREKTADPRFSFDKLVHGRTIHGLQLLAPDVRDYPTSYFAKNSGVGLLLQNIQRPASGLRVGDVGLGIGTIASYGRPGDLFRFYEIDPMDVRVAMGRYGFFSFIADSQAKIETVEGDARISLEREPSQQFDVLIVDAFNSDSIPVHLLTREAFELYLRHLRGPESVIAVHVSNKALDLPPVVEATAKSIGLEVAHVKSHGLGDIISESEWMLISRSPAELMQPAISQASTPVGSSRRVQAWTDDYSNLLQILR
jgi:hypothetical protein